MFRHWTACLRSALWIGSFVAVLRLMNQSSLGQQDFGAKTDEARERLVLLTTGRMLTGQVTRNAGGYLVEQPNGRIQVLNEDVKFVVNDLREAYRKQRDSIVEPTPATHVALANWCISYRLHDEARDELKKCLKTDPENAEARRLLQRLSDTIRAGMPAKADEPQPRKTLEGFAQPSVESLGGLSRETASQFTSRIQPLLLNKCGNASCHAQGSANEFRLSMARGGAVGSRRNTEHNLAETLRYIDLEEVNNSRLLRTTKGSHGGKGTIFSGPGGAEQMKLLRAWALAVVEEKQAEAEMLEMRPRLAGKRRAKHRVIQASATGETSVKVVKTSVNSTDHPSTGVEVPDDEPHDEPRPLVDSPAKPRELRADPTDAVELAKEPSDPFDPDIFNQKIHRR